MKRKPKVEIQPIPPTKEDADALIAAAIADGVQQVRDAIHDLGLTVGDGCFFYHREAVREDGKIVSCKATITFPAPFDPADKWTWDSPSCLFEVWLKEGKGEEWDMETLPADSAQKAIESIDEIIAMIDERDDGSTSADNHLTASAKAKAKAAAYNDRLVADGIKNLCGVLAAYQEGLLTVDHQVSPEQKLEIWEVLDQVSAQVDGLAGAFGGPWTRSPAYPLAWNPPIPPIPAEALAGIFG